MAGLMSSGKHTFRMRRFTLDRLAQLWLPIFSLGLSLFAGAGSVAHAAARAGWTYAPDDGSGASGAFYACDNTIEGGQIAGSVRGCADPLFQVPKLTNVALPTGGSGALEFLWMKTTTNPASGQPVSWTIIPGSSGSEYTPAAVTKTTYYMRCSRRAGCEKWAGETNFVTVLIDCCENVTDGGRIGGAQTSCGVPYDPSVITNLAPATGGTNSLVYTWYQSNTSTTYQPGSPEWSVASSETTPYFDPSAISQPTSYVRVAQRDKCPVPGAWSNVITIAANPLPAIKANVKDVSCAGDSDGSITVTVLTAVAPVTLRWADIATAPASRTNLAAGAYVVIVTDGAGCEYTEDIIVGAPAPLTVTLAPTVDNCDFNNDATVASNVLGGTMPYTYVWAHGPTTANLSGLAAGTYSVTVTDAKGCSATQALTIAPPPKLAGTATATQPTCGINNGSVNVAQTGGVAPFTYAWSPAVSNGNTARNLAGGAYAISITDANGCVARVTVDLVVIAPVTVALDGDDVTCNGAANAEVRSTVGGGIAPYTYRWNTGATSAKLSNVGPGRYEVTVTDAAGCVQVGEITLSQPNALAATITAVQPACFEDGGSLTANISGGTPPYTFNWGAAGRTNEQTLSNLAAGTYTLNVADGGGCVFTTTATIEATTLLSLDTLTTPASCLGSDDGSAEVKIVGGTAPYKILWSDARGQTSAKATVLLADTYTVSFEDARGCVKTAALKVGTLSTGPVTTGEVDQITCPGVDDGAIRLTTTSGLAPHTYVWKDSPSASATRTGLAAKVYEVRVTDAAGCFTDETYTIVAPDPITCKALPTTAFPRYFHVSTYGAKDGGLRAQASGGTAPYTYDWSTAATAESITGLAGGDYRLTVKDAKGCSCTHDTTLVEPSQISDFVWEDIDGDGIQDAGEPGLAGIQIRLSGQDFNGFAVDFSTTSDARGAYKFDRLPMGKYVIRFRLQGFQDYLFSPANQGDDDTKDSDMDPVLLLARAEVTAHGVADLDLDAGFIPRASVITVGDMVWYDEDHDGIQDPFEAPVQGVTMQLIRSSDNAVVSTTVSNESGAYAFNDVIPNTYYVRFDQSTSSVAFEFIAAPQAQGSDRAADSDFDPTTRRSIDIVVTSTTADITDLDLGLHEACTTVADGGQIASDEQVCVGQTASVIGSARPATGSVRYQWLRSTTSGMYRGPNDPAWATVTGAVGSTYQPSSIAVTSHYVRLSRDRSCASDFTGTTNVVTKEAIPNPRVTFASVTGSNGATYVNGQISLGLNEVMTVTADSTAPVTFNWNFGADATPRTATGRVVRDISYAKTNDSRYVHLAITNTQGCVGRDSFLVNTLPFLVPGELGGTSAIRVPGGNKVKWSALSLPAGAYFNIERAADEGAYRKVGTMVARAIGSWTDYEFVDAGAPSGKTVYRVVHLSAKGEVNYGRPAAVTAEQSLSVVTYPNPVRDLLGVEALMGQEDVAAQYTLTNVYGATVLKGTLDVTKPLDLSSLSAGTYYLSVVSEAGEVVIRPVVKY